MKRTFVGITGASGHPYALTLVRALLDAGNEVQVAITDAGCKVLRHETGLDPGPRGARLQEVLQEELCKDLDAGAPARLRAFSNEAIEAPPSSGTSLTGGVVIAPCSMGTLARISAGFSSNLVERAADVALKERRRLVLVPRETPLSEIHLENLLRLTRMGAVVLPAMPGFYHHPRTMQDLVDHVVGKVLDALGVEHALGARWRGQLKPPPQDPGLGRSS